MIDKKLIPVGGLKKEPFSGSHHGMRYYFLIDDGKETFSVYIYPEPWSFENTPREDKTSASFSADDSGMDAAITWLWEQYETRKEFWQNASKEAMHTVNHHS